MARRDRRAAAGDYEPDALQKALTRFFGALTASGERVIYLIIAAAAILVVAAWFFAGYKQEKSRDALNSIDAAIEKDDTEELDEILARHADLPEVASWVLDRANAMFHEAVNADDAAVRNANYQQAEKFYRLFAGKFPEHELLALAHHGRGCVLEQLGDDEGACEAFRQALKSAPMNMKERFSYDVGRVLMATGRAGEARPFLEDATLGVKVVAQDPRSGQVMSLEAGTPIARMMVIEGDYQWRLNAKQLLAELKDEEGASKVEALAASLPEEEEEEEEEAGDGEEGSEEKAPDKQQEEGEGETPEKKEGAEEAQPADMGNATPAEDEAGPTAGEQSH